jgi:hypothetical protein
LISANLIVVSFSTNQKMTSNQVDGKKFRFKYSRLTVSLL